MKKIITLILIILTIAVFVMAGPAPNSGDGIPDGSGMDGALKTGKTFGETSGPAPNSGDGIPDGPGW